MEGLKLVDLFSNAGEFDRASGDRAKGEGGAATGIAIEFRQDESGETESGVEVLGHAHGLLAGGGIADEENFLWLEKVAKTLEFFDERTIDFLATGGIEDLHVAASRVAPF